MLEHVTFQWRLRISPQLVIQSQQFGHWMQIQKQLDQHFLQQNGTMSQ